tara:strand:- start:1936 stop:2058 length:123 start_codon:yes stop_codon:yes gene_type:complete
MRLLMLLILLLPVLSFGSEEAEKHILEQLQGFADQGDANA